MKLSKAKDLAKGIVEKLKAHCEKIEVGGSIRRNRPEVKDIEIILIPKMANKRNRSTGWIRTVKGLGHIYKSGDKLNTAKYIQTALGQENIKVDIFVATQENWAMIKMIRTGPSDFSTSMLVRFNQFGYKSEGGIPYKIQDPTIRLSFESEEKIFDFLNIGYVSPENRDGYKMKGVTDKELEQFTLEQEVILEVKPQAQQQSLF